MMADCAVAAVEAYPDAGRDRRSALIERRYNLGRSGYMQFAIPISIGSSPLRNEDCISCQSPRYLATGKHFSRRGLDAIC